MIEEYEGYFLSSDNDGHWYVIPIDKEEEWSEFMDLDEDDIASWDVPEWADAIGGAPSLVRFTDYKIL